MMDIIKRDHIVFAVAMGVVSAGLADGLHRGFGVPWWGAVPFGLATWATFAGLTYRHYQDALLRAEEADA